MCTHRKMTLLLTLLLGLACWPLPAQTSLGSITVTGNEQSSGGTWDTGTVTVTINGVSVYFTYGQFSSPAAIASALGAQISQNCNMPVYAKASGATLTLYKKGTNTVTSASITSVSNNPLLFPSNSFLVGGGATWAAPQITGLSLSEGPPSMGFQINGTGFGFTPASVTIGGATATIVSWSPTSIVVQVPNGATTGNVVVSVSGFASSWPFTVVAPFGCN